MRKGRVAFSLALCATVAIGAPVRADSGIAISLSVGNEIGPVVADITKGTCKVKGSGAHRRFVVTGRSTDDKYLLVLQVSDFAGYGKAYEIHPGMRKPAAFHLYGPKGLVYSNLAHDPGEVAPLLQTGMVGFRHKGGVLRFAAVAPEDEDVNKGVQLLGAMKCH